MDSKQRFNVTLVPLVEEDRDQFVRDNQEAFLYGAMHEGARAHHGRPSMMACLLALPGSCDLQ